MATSPVAQGLGFRGGDWGRGGFIPAALESVEGGDDDFVRARRPTIRASPRQVDRNGDDAPLKASGLQRRTDSGKPLHKLEETMGNVTGGCHCGADLLRGHRGTRLSTRCVTAPIAGATPARRWSAGLMVAEDALKADQGRAQGLSIRRNTVGGSYADERPQQSCSLQPPAYCRGALLLKDGGPRRRPDREIQLHERLRRVEGTTTRQTFDAIPSEARGRRHHREAASTTKRATPEG